MLVGRLLHAAQKVYGNPRGEVEKASIEAVQRDYKRLQQKLAKLLRRG